MATTAQWINIPFLKRLALILTIAAIVLTSMSYWWKNKHYANTDDAYVNADIVQIAPRVTGQVTQLHIHNNQYVTRNQPLLDVDATPFEIAATEAMAQLEKNKSELNMAMLTSNRTIMLVQKHVASTQQGDTVETDLRSAKAAIQLGEASLKKAKLNLSYAKITAPTSGWVTNVTVHSGNMIQANQPLFALISDDVFWVDANFKETDVGKIHPEQKVDVTVDMYPKHHFTGIVDSISGGSGNAFSLLPPQNATGNWVKVTQRVPVRIRITNPDPKYPLRVGTSATVKVRIG
jgi:membrane fusion protein (multidrug efflux system)